MCVGYYVQSYNVCQRDYLSAHLWTSLDYVMVYKLYFCIILCKFDACAKKCEETDMKDNYVCLCCNSRSMFGRRDRVVGQFKGGGRANKE